MRDRTTLDRRAAWRRPCTLAPSEVDMNAQPALAAQPCRDEPRVYWRRELPPLAEQPREEHVVQARSAPVRYSSIDRDQLWGRCYPGLMEAAAHRVAQEVERLHGSCAHIVDEFVEPKINNATDEYWLEGRFTYVLYQHP
jgi:bisphosphoglycerate-independent phosphoglycerate mutase (AlkP superfamily)